MVHFRTVLLLPAVAVVLLLLVQSAASCRCPRVDVCNCQLPSTRRTYTLPSIRVPTPRRVCEYVGGSCGGDCGSPEVTDSCGCDSCESQRSASGNGPALPVMPALSAAESLRQRLEERRVRRGNLRKAVLRCGCGFLNCMCKQVVANNS